MKEITYFSKDWMRISSEQRDALDGRRHGSKMVSSCTGDGPKLRENEINIPSEGRQKSSRNRVTYQGL